MDDIIIAANQKVKQSVTKNPEPNRQINTDSADLISQLLSGKKKDKNGATGVFIGDLHGYFNCPEFLTDNMSKFKKAGLNKIFMEMFRAEDKEILNRYYNNKASDDELIAYLKDGWEKKPGTAKRYFEVVKAAKANGIRVYGIDEPKKDFFEKPIEQRLQRSNPFWKRQILKNSTPKDKYIVFGGAGHSANYPRDKGVNVLLGNIPAVDFDRSKTGKAYVEKGDGKDSDYKIYLPRAKGQPLLYLDELDRINSKNNGRGDDYYDYYDDYHYHKYDD